MLSSSSLLTRTARSVMRAAVVSRFGGPDVIEIKNDHVKPTIQKPSQVLIKVFSAGINPVDTYIRSGQYGALPQLPYIPGRDGSGIIVEVGADVKHLKQKDPVWFLMALTGASAEFAVVEAATTFHLPRGLTPDQGACIGVPYLTAHRALFVKGHAKAGERVLVHGATGGVGQAAMQLASAHGCIPIGTYGSEDGAAIYRTFPDVTLYNHRSEGYVDEIKRDFPEGFDLIIEMLANKNLAVDMGLLRQGGRIAVVGNRGEINVNPRALMMKESSVFGVALNTSSMAELAEGAAAIRALFHHSEMRPTVKKVFPIEGLAQAHAEIIDPAIPAAGNLVLHLGDE